MAMLTRILSALIALACIALLVIAQLRHPFSPWWPVPLMLGFAALTWFVRGWWITILLAMLPILDLGQYSGSFFFEEFDYAAASVAAAGYLRMFAFGGTAPLDRERGAWLRAGTLLVTAYLATVAVSILIALLPLAPLDANAFAHYFSRYNALRVGKSGFAAALLLPLVLHEFHRDAARARGAVLAGLALAFGTAGLSVVWERMAFANLTDFSSDFRATGIFAATNTGGAALDAVLAMTMPFSIAALLQERSRLRFLFWVTALGLGGYAMFVTFSRALYASAAVILVFQLYFASRNSAPGTPGNLLSRSVAVLKTLALAATAFWVLEHVFSFSGYRGTAAMAGSFLALYLISSTPMGWSAASIAAALPLVVLTGCIAVFVPFGPYLAFGLMFALVMALIAGAPERRLRHAWPATLVLTGCAVVVAASWGGEAALPSALVAAGIAWTLALFNAQLKGALWRVSAESIPVVFLGGLGILASVVAAHSWYASSRFETTSSDWDSRVHHWEDVASAMDHDAVSLLFGMGVGRMPEVYFWRNAGADIAGSFAFTTEQGNQFMRLSGGRYLGGFGDPLKIMQVLKVRSPRLRISFQTRSTTPKAAFDVAVCIRHVIYIVTCQGKPVGVVPDGAWHRHVVDLDTSGIAGAAAQFPRPVFLVFSTETQKAVIDVDEFEVNGVFGEALSNGRFTDGMDHWFFTSDRSHLAWHAKNAFLHVMFEQGAIGVLLLTGMLLVALGRLWGPARQGSAVAVALIGALGGFVMVGAFDSLFDAPRVAFLFYALLFGVLAVPRRLAFNTQKNARKN